MKHESNIQRRKTRQIMVGNVPVGGNAPISVQSMTNTETTDGRAHSAYSLNFIEADSKKAQGIHSGGITNAVGVIQDRLHYPFTALANVTFNTKQFSLSLIHISEPTRPY